MLGGRSHSVMSDEGGDEGPSPGRSRVGAQFFNQRDGRRVRRLPDAFEVARLERLRRLGGGTNRLRLMFEELEKSLQVDYAKLKVLDKLIAAVKLAILSAKPREIGADDFAAYPGIRFFNRPEKLTAGRALHFSPPKRCAVLGSYAAKLVHAGNKNVDIFCVVPDGFLLQRDYLNYRFHDKRAVYLAELAKQIKAAVTPADAGRGGNAAAEAGGAAAGCGNPFSGIPGISLRSAKFCARDGDPSRLCLSFQFSVCRNGHRPALLGWRIRVFAVPSPSIFKLRALRWEANCLRDQAASAVQLEPFKPEEAPAVGGPGEKSASRPAAGGARAPPGAAPQPPTPWYNSALLADVASFALAKEIAGVCDAVPAFRAAVLLLAQWLRAATGGRAPLIPKFLAAAVAAHVCKAYSREAGGSAPAQLLRLVFSHLAEFDFADVARPVFFGKRGKAEADAGVDVATDGAAAGGAGGVAGSSGGGAGGATTGSRRAARHYAIWFPVHAPKAAERQVQDEAADAGIPAAPTQLNLFWSVQEFVPELQHCARRALELLAAADAAADSSSADVSDASPALASAGDGASFGSSTAENVFDSLFDAQRDDVPVEAAADVFLRGSLNRAKKISLPVLFESDEAEIKAASSVDYFTEWGNPPHVAVVRHLQRLLRRGLGDRLHAALPFRVRYSVPDDNVERSTVQRSGVASSAIDFRSCRPPQRPWDAHAFSWDVDGRAAGKGQRSRLNFVLALSLNSQRQQERGEGHILWRRVDRGVPVSDAARAAAYKQFWGISSTRRFQDGSINEAVVWEPPSPLLAGSAGLVECETKLFSRTPSIPQQIVSHLLARHLPPTVPRWLETKDGLFGIQSRPAGAFFADDTRSRALPHPADIFGELKTVLVSLDISVPVRDVRAVDYDGILSQTDVPPFSPAAGGAAAAPAGIRRIPVIVEFSAHKSWMASAEANDCLKTALLAECCQRINDAGAAGKPYALRAALAGRPGSPDVFMDVAAVATDSREESEATARTVLRVHPFYAAQLGGTLQVLGNPAVVAAVMRETENELAPAEPAPGARSADVQSPRSRVERTVAKILDHLDSEEERQRFVRQLADVRKFVYAPAFRQAVAAAGVRHGNAFGATVRLAKLWAATQLLPLEDVAELLEFLTIAAFRYRSCEINTASVGFAYFLHFVRSLDVEQGAVSVHLRLRDLEETETGLSVRLEPKIQGETQGEGFSVNYTSDLDPLGIFTHMPHPRVQRRLFQCVNHCFEKLCSGLEEHGGGVKPEPKAAAPTAGRATPHPWVSFLTASPMDGSLDLRCLFETGHESQFHARLGLSASHLLQHFDKKRIARDILLDTPVKEKKASFSNTGRRKRAAKGKASLADFADVAVGGSVLPKFFQCAKEAAGVVQDVYSRSMATEERALFEGIGAAVMHAQKKPLSGVEAIASGVSVVQDVFSTFIAKVMKRFGTDCSVYYNSLEHPIPKNVFVQWDGAFFRHENSQGQRSSDRAGPGTIQNFLSEICVLGDGLIVDAAIFECNGC